VNNRFKRILAVIFIITMLAGVSGCSTLPNNAADNGSNDVVWGAGTNDWPHNDRSYNDSDIVVWGAGTNERSLDDKNAPQENSTHSGRNASTDSHNSESSMLVKIIGYVVGFAIGASL